MPLPSPIAALLPWRRSPARPAPTERPRLPADLARKVRRIEIATQRLVAQGVAGEYHSVFKGRGVEFAEVRPYQPGDDVRAIDWNVTARMGEPYVKTYVEERDLAVFLAIDVSGSQSFGSRAIVKRDLAAEVAALLAFAAVANGDRVGAALLSDRMELYLAPARRRTHVLRLIREVLVRPAGGGTDLGAGLTQVLATSKRSSVLFLISDFLCLPFPRALQAAAARHDLVVIEIVDPRDDRLPEVGPVPLTDAETGRTALVDGSRRAAEHAERSRSERRELRRTLRRLGVDHLVLR
ncbi:MAG TPA: DUF58 domain-containing protein, partial [Thermoanaerobaculia bacterium]|nr:DUF58 domain-containing protein [Thermoanaerobaculia bacterium]